jgi:SAM-dependent methyltransferase
MSLLYPLRRIFRRTDRTMHPFDRMHRVDTSGLLYPDQLATGSPADALSEGYYATAPSLFHGMISLWRRHLGRPLSSYAFIDLGCGKGRALLLASTYPFRQVIGIELHSDLAQTARRNAARWLRTPRACGEIKVVTGDATVDPLDGIATDVPVICFLFNSFGEDAVRRLARNLAAAAQTRTAPIDLIYLHPDQHHALRQSAGMQILADEELPLSPEDVAADAFAVETDRCTLYRVAGLG